MQPSRHYAGLVLLVGLLSGLFSNAWAEEKGASVSLRAKWRGSPYLHEAAEFVAEDDRDKIWQFLEASFLQEQPLDVSMCWAHITDLTSSLLDKSVSKVVPLSLASRKYSAKLAMYQQILEETHPTVQSCCIVDVMGHVATSLEDLTAAIQKASSSEKKEDSLQLFPFDHVYRGKVDGTGAAPAVLYAPVGAACAKKLHFALKVAANAGHIVYAYRPVLHTSCQVSEGSCTQLGAHEPLLLPGWGVEAVLKNTEYSAMDDKDKKAEAAAKGKAAGKASGKAESLGKHEGFLFDTLVKRKPALAQELLTFRDHLMSMDEDDNVKVWDLKDVGLQATQRIMQAADPLSLLTELSQNFPSLVSSLSRQEVNASLRGAVTHNQQYLSPGRNFMLLNGLMVDINDLDYFGLLDRLKSELQLMEVLSNLGLDHEDMKQLMQLRVDDTSDAMEDARLELGVINQVKHKDKVFYVNNVAMDEQYQGMSKRISDVLNTYPNRLRPIGLNVYSLVLVVDPVSADGLLWAETYLKSWQEGVTVNFGVTLKVPDVLARVRAKRTNPLAGDPKAPAWQYKSASERFALAFLTIDTAFTEYHAVLFWVQLANKVLRRGTWGDDIDDTIRSVFESYWQQASAQLPKSQDAWTARNTESSDAWQQLKDGTAYSEKAAARLVAISEWLDNKGIADFDGPVGWLNGMQCVFTPGADVQALQQELLYKVLMEQQRLQEAVYYGRIEDNDNVQEKLMEMSGTLMRWNPSIISADKRKYVLLNALVQDKDFSKLVPRFARPQVAPFKDDADNMELHPATHIVVCNIDTRQGRQLAAEALRFLTGDLPGSASSRVLLIFNPAHQEAALPNTPPSMLETVVHMALAQLPQFSGQSELKVSTLSVAEFLSQLLGDEALAVRFTEPIAANSATEIGVALEYARKTGVNADLLKKGILNVLDVMPDSGGVARYRPTPEMVAMRSAHARMARSALNLEMGTSSLISNGRVVATYSPADEPGTVPDIVAEDIDLVTSIATKYQANQAMASQVDEAYRQGRVKKMPTLDQKHPDSIVAKLDDLVAAASAAISYLGKAEGRQMSKQLTQVLAYMKGRTVEVEPPAGVEPSGLHIVCIINPLTRPAQRISQVLSMLRGSLLAPTISLILNPELDLSELPLKSFYRYALPDIAPGEQGLSVLPTPPAAYFSRLPRKRVLTLNMDVPEAWLVEAVQSQHDLDNLRLADVPEPVAYAELELSALMLTGSCIDVTAGGNRGTPPRGLQLHLGTPSNPHVVDTLVMSNLAYFQLKAAPGRWLLSLAPGRTRDLYQLVSSTPLANANVPITVKALDANEDKARNELSTIVAIHSLSGKHMILRVRKRPGMEREDVLKAAGEESSDEDVWGGAYYGQDDDDDIDDEDDAGPSAKAVASKKPGGDVINVFTVASGHMYERLQKIMMLSVINNTKSRVKFWFISNYMSPHHKQVIPAMAEKFGFDWEFVTYKWPHWLHKQTDKQRIIWAYKILFLDVLFPLGVERIIFVDSDQVVRADLAELYHMDIKGKPYAYTPFCNNNKEMDEFRFWNGGFWKSHLQGKPYHISALYLVDLKRFRAIAAGDKLRVVYDQLSKDPNSLANLDQDLPNYAQHQIPIHSLPKEWLWCESWCGVSTKKKAKTIDLCNNPKTKEPKLSAARRIIAEWPELDRMQAEFTQQFDAEQGFDNLSSAQEAAAVEAANLADLMADTSTEPEANTIKDEL